MRAQLIMTDTSGIELTNFALGNVQEQYDALRNLIAKRTHHAATKDPAFQQGMETLYEVAADPSGKDLDRLLALATLGRIASTIKKLRKTVYSQIKQILENPIPDPHFLSEPDDRSYIGIACATANPKWAIEYCARATIYEETGEQARVAFLKALLVLKEELAPAIVVITPFLKNFQPVTEDPGTSLAIRVKRLMAALRLAISETLVEPGDEPGKRLSDAIRAAFVNNPPAKKMESVFEATEEIAGAIHEMVRLRFSLATDANTYSALKVVKAHTIAHEWERYAIKSASMQRVALDITEAILILARQGIADSRLASELTIVSGSSKHGKRRMKELAKSPGLSAEIKNWMIKGTLGDSTIKSEQGESRTLDDDSLLAAILVDSLRFRSVESSGRQHVLPEIEMLDPRLGGELEQLMNHGLTICDSLEALGRKKGLRVRGNVGDEEEYAPLEHEVIGVNTGVRRVRVIRPVVEQVREDGVAFVISKGLVESIK
jgi:hypothetical protein